MSNIETRWVGQALERTEDRRLITRGGHFIDDLTLPGVAHAAYVRSPHARALIRRIDVRRALEHRGVYALITGGDVAQLTRPQRGRVPLPNSPKVYALAYQQVRYVGEPVVGVAAVDRATAEDAADLVDVEYDPLPPVIDAEEALKTNAPLVFEEVGSNILWHDTFPYGDVEGAFAQADKVVNERVTIHRYCSTPLETFGVMAQYEAAGRADLAEKEKQELAILMDFLPQQLTEEEIASLVDLAVLETKAQGEKDFGKVMGALASKIKGRADGAAVSKIVKAKLLG